MNVEGVIPDLDTFILCSRNAYNRGALCADTLRVMGYRMRDSLLAASKALGRSADRSGAFLRW